MELWERFYNLSEIIEDREYSYLEMKIIKTSWDMLSKDFLTQLKIEDLTNMWTYLSDDICSDNHTGNELLQEFKDYLCYASDRMNLNRWCRLQLILGNAINNRYGEEESNKYEGQ